MFSKYLVYGVCTVREYDQLGSLITYVRLNTKMHICITNVSKYGKAHPIVTFKKKIKLSSVNIKLAQIIQIHGLYRAIC